MPPLREVSIRVIKAHADYDWQVTQKFEKLGKPVTVTAWGHSRKDALKRFEQEKLYAAQADADLLEDLGCWLMDMGKTIDNIIRRLT